MTSSKERTLTTVEGTAPPHKLAQVLTEGPLPQLLEPIRSIGSRSAFAAARGRRQVQGGSQSDSRADGEGAAYAQQHQPLSGLDYKVELGFERSHRASQRGNDVPSRPVSPGQVFRTPESGTGVPFCSIAARTRCWTTCANDYGHRHRPNAYLR